MRTFSITSGNSQYTWDVENLWDSTSEIKGVAIPMSDLTHTLEWDCWDGKMKPKNLLHHYQRLLEADLHFPILIVRQKDGRVCHVIDGMHRIVKAFALKHEKIFVKELSVDWLFKQPHVEKHIFCDACGCDPCDCHWGDQ